MVDSSIPGLVRELGGQDGALTFDEAVGHVNGLKLRGPETRPVKTDRPVGKITVGDLPIRFLDSISGKVEQFCDAVQHVRWNMTQDCFDSTIYKECITSNYKGLPEPFRLKHEPKVPYTMQIVILPASPPEDAAADDDGTYIHVFKHVYLHRNKMTARECIDMCYGIALRFEWGTHTRAALMALNYMIDGMGGKQIRYWFVQPKFEKKVTVDQSARDAGYKFIRDMGPRANNLNQFMEWTDTQIHTVGSPIEGTVYGLSFSFPLQQPSHPATKNK